MTAKKSMLQDFVELRRLWPFTRGSRGIFIFSLIMVPLISLIEIFVPLTVRKAIDSGAAKGDWAYLSQMAGLYLALVIAQYLTRSLQSLASARAVFQTMYRLRMKVVRHIMSLRCEYHDRSLSGSLVTRATTDFETLSESLNSGVLTSIIDFAVLIGSFIGLLYLNWVLALCALIIVPAVFLIVGLFSSWLKTTMLLARAKVAALNAYTQECLYGHQAIRLLTAQTEVQKKHDSLAEAYRVDQMKSVRLDAVLFSIVDGLTSITVGIVLWVAVSDFKLDVSVGVLVAFVQYIQQMFEPVKQLSNKIAIFQGAFTAMDRITQILETTDFVKGHKIYRGDPQQIHFDHVSFRYRKDTPLVLNDVSFQLEAGSSVALVGPTGSGKSSVVKLLAKLYDGWEGSITIDGHDLSDFDAAEWRRSIAIVPQDIIMFDGTIAFNIGLNRDGVSREQVQRAAESVGAHRFIEGLPGGYDFLVREQGGNLSHGMRQLIAFARAIVLEPRLLILDEATASIDPESEQIVQAGMEALMRGRTVVIVAHRLATVRKCDQILVFQYGKLVEVGNHASLLAQDGIYAQFHRVNLSDG